MSGLTNRFLMSWVITCFASMMISCEAQKDNATESEKYGLPDNFHAALLDEFSQAGFGKPDEIYYGAVITPTFHKGNQSEVSLNRLFEQLKNLDGKYIRTFIWKDVKTNTSEVDVLAILLISEDGSKWLTQIRHSRLNQSDN